MNQTELEKKVQRLEERVAHLEARIERLLGGPEPDMGKITADADIRLRGERDPR